jgi:SAM-dependent methyltransferase
VRPRIKEFVGICGKHLALQGPVYEFGSLQVPGQEGFADLRPFFPGQKYVGFDMRKGPGVDEIADVHDLRCVKLRHGLAGTILCIDTLEHVRNPMAAVNEMKSLLAPGGHLIITSHMYKEIHDYPHDYWRFTPDCFANLLSSFSGSLVVSAGRVNFPHTVIGIASSREMYLTQSFVSEVQRWKRMQDLLSLPFPGGLPW